MPTTRMDGSEIYAYAALGKNQGKNKKYKTRFTMIIVPVKKTEKHPLGNMTSAKLEGPLIGLDLIFLIGMVVDRTYIYSTNKPVIRSFNTLSKYVGTVH